MSSQSAATTLPLTPGTWSLDPNHSGVHFKVRHIGLTNVRGRFNRLDATLTVGEDLEHTHVEATIEMSSVDTNQPDRDTHLRSTDFFSADEHLTMEFRSSAVRPTGDAEFDLDGELTINGITKPVTLAVEFAGVETFPGDGRTHAGFTATAQINRDEFDIDFNMPLGMDKLALGKKIAVEIELQFVAPSDS